MTDITPTWECVKQWLSEFYGAPTAPVESTMHVATRAAQWGADQELEACCEWLRANGLFETRIQHLRAARRPKPPTLKEQALSEIAAAVADGGITPEKGATIRLALEGLPND